MIDAVAETVKTLRAIPGILPALLAHLDDDSARRRPAPQEWSVVEVVAHMRDVEQHALARIQRMVSEDTPYLAAFDHEQLAADSKYQSLPLHETLQQYLSLRAEHLHLLDHLDTVGWQRPGRHETHGDVTVASYEVHVAAEEVDHLAQISRLLP